MITTSSAAPDDLADFVDRMDTRRKKLAQGCLRRDRLDFAAHPGAKCLLFKAPRGFGKSVQIALCAQAAIDRGEDCVYLDLSSFWQEGVSEAEFVARAIVAVLAPKAFRGMQARPSLKNAALRLLLGRKEPVTICLDGVTDIFTIQRFLKTITLETPETVRLAVSERLPGTMVTLSVLSDVVTIGPGELSFTLDETQSVLSVETDRAEKIFDMAGGWPLLCTLAGQSNTSGEAIVHLPEIQAYFENDVLAQVSRPLRECLVNASWLEEITAEACDYVFKTHDSAGKLAELASLNSLLTTSSDRPNCFELNPTLRAYLRNRFIEEYGSRRSYFLKRIAFWHWRRSEHRLVVDVALRAQDHNWAQRLTDQALLDLALRQGEIEALTIWFTGIPRAKLFGMPSLAIGYAWVLFFSQRAGEAHDILEKLNTFRGAALTAQDDPNGWAELVRSIGLATHDALKESDESCAAWIDTYGLANPVGRAAAQTCRAFIAASDRQFSVLSDQIASATVVSGAVRHRYAFGWLAAAGVLARLLNGDIHGARREIRSAQENENVAYKRTPFVKGMIATMELQIQAEDGSVTPDESTVQEALDFALEFGVTDVVWNTVRTAYEIYIRQGDTSRAFLLLERCRLLAKESGLKRLGMLVRLGTEVFAMGTRTSTALAAEPLPSDEDLPFLPNQNRAIQAESALLQASRFLRDGKLGLAERQARKALSDFTAVKDQRGEIRAEYTLAATLYLMGEEKQAQKRIAEANHKAQQLGSFRTLLNRHHFLRVICPDSRALLRQTAIEISAFAEPPNKAQGDQCEIADRSAVISQKQVRVLQYAALGLSNKEIAARLHITEDTVKWHFKKVMRGLKAGNRTEAVLIARSRGLI
ncbi:LuxR family transcriptional regulator [Salipiger aestuarii]|uniref:ATP/maltotriose-dependent transcriptional regulator MalT n=1 Tax=Salipiger aestuarii TaxID=568098 RepID=A0A327XNF8_9RHOB|nr:LuxR C-terminal-related transcriptional regulator [Salipiger aestuarii]KAB2535696.1 LuxR family transcriptional regulator [Salipiger aestuarii]RAK10648.1 ATP/maltotriose-dependent transcriptional regulator MalT [Salipiger aestuarii]